MVPSGPVCAGSRPSGAYKRHAWSRAEAPWYAGAVDPYYYAKCGRTSDGHPRRISAELRWNGSSTAKAHDAIYLLRGDPISSPKPIQIILARQLASSLATPILIVDTDGTLIFYNEPAEVILDQRFEETGEMPADAWSGLFAVADEERKPIAQEDRPMMMALSERKPVSRTVWMRCGRGEWLHVNITAFPLIGEERQFLGAQMIFWEV